MRYRALMSLLCLAASARGPGGSLDWTRFGFDAGRSNAPSQAMGVTAANVAAMRKRTVSLPGTVDASAIYLHGVTIGGAVHDAIFVTTTYGKTLAIDADSGAILWDFTPADYSRFAGSYQITTATPVADPDREAIYAASPDGAIQKLAVADGRVLWRTAITRLPRREKIASSLNFFRGRVIATTGGYIGDRPPYQGHVALLDGASGALVQVWNSLCSERHELIEPGSCRESASAIWGRAGAVVDTATGNLFVATGNGKWDGATSWGDAVIELDADARRVVGNYTPTNTEELDRDDADLGSTSPVLLGGGLVAQGGKDREIRVLAWADFRGAAPHRGGEGQQFATPSGGGLFTAPAVWRARGTTWLIAADYGGTSVWRLRDGSFEHVWHTNRGGTSPVVVDGMAFVYNGAGGLVVYDAPSGRVLAELECGTGHWNSPIVVDGRIILPEGNANDHRTNGVLDIWTVARN